LVLSTGVSTPPIAWTGPPGPFASVSGSGSEVSTQHQALAALESSSLAFQAPSSGAGNATSGQFALNPTRGTAVPIQQPLPENAGAQPFSGAQPVAVPVKVMSSDGQLVPLQTAGPTGYTPQQLQTAYGLNQVNFAGIKGDGTGQTIALVDAYDNPSFVDSTDPSFDTSALHLFDQEFGLPDPPSFTKVNELGQSSPLAPAAPAGPDGWGVEIAIDIEWAHAMAPGANIVLVEASTNLFTAAATAGTVASVVSMSWGGSEFPTDVSQNSIFQVPGVTFLASTGDSGAPGGYPAYSPYVVAVGGTSLQNLDSSGDYPGTGPDGEVGWSDGGGGVSQYQAEPSYQESVQTTGQRTIPDIAADADPNTGVPIYDPYDFGNATPWAQYGGTSLSSPLMAGMVAIADEGRVLSGGQTFSSVDALTALYSLETTNPTDFHDILYGDNGYSAGPGYDLVTGLGTPNGSQLVPDLAYFGLSTRPTVTSIAVTPTNPSVGEGQTEQFTATGTFLGGITADITSSVTWASDTPSVATIDSSGLATTFTAGTSVITASLDGVTSPDDTLTSLPVVSLAIAPIDPYIPVGLSLPFTVTATYSDNSTDPLPSTSVTWASDTPSVATIDASGLATANGLGTSNITATFDGVTSPEDVLTVIAPSFVVNTTSDDLSFSPGETTLREAVLESSVYPGQTISFDPSVFATPETITLALGVLELTDTFGTTTITGPTAGVTVDGGGLSGVFQVDGGVNVAISGLTITDGSTGGNGGGLFDDGGTVTLTDCTVSDNYASDRGGGVRVYLGTATLTDCTISGNSAGGSGGGVFIGSGSTATLTDCTISGNSGNVGGGVYNNGYLTLTGSTVSGNSTQGYFGGGIDNAYGTATLTNCTVTGNSSLLGGGITNGINSLGYYEAASLSLTNVTVADNSAFYGGGIFNGYLSSASLTNTIVAGNSSDITSFQGLTGTYNLIGTGGSGGLVNGVDGNIVGVADAGLAPLGNYGGPTETIALLPGSSAIDEGTSGPGIPSTDQRGLGRYGAVDIGAFESQGFVYTIAPGSTPQSSDIGTLFANPLSVSVTANNSVEPVDGAIVRFVNQPALDGAAALLSADSAVITDGTVEVTAAPNNILGEYTVIALASGTPIASFDLTNTGTIYSSLVVNTPIDSLAPGPGLLSLREAVDFANGDNTGNSVITFDPGVFNVPTEIDLLPSLGTLELSNTSEPETIMGPAAPLTISGGDAIGVFQIDAGVAATLSSLTITGGYAYQGAGIADFGTLNLNASVLTGDTATYAGGGLYITGYSAAATLTDSTINGNSAEFGGGALSVFGASLTLTDSMVSGNTAVARGGGIYSLYGPTTVTGGAISGNSAYFGGGAVDRDGTLSMTDCTVSGNTAADLAGGLYLAGYYANSSLTECHVSGNSAPFGGAILGFDGTITLTECSVTGNTSSERGGGIYAGFSSITLYKSSINGNYASSGGGGVFNLFGPLSLTECSISGNSTNGIGGGVVSVYGYLSLTRCKVSGNVAGISGGGVYAAYNVTSLTDSSVRGNYAGSTGGGIDAVGSAYGAAYTTTLTDSQVLDNNVGYGNGGGLSLSEGTASLTGCTIAGNSAGGLYSGGGGLYNNSGVTTLTDCTVSGNSAANGGGMLNRYGSLSVIGSGISGNSSRWGGGVYTGFYQGGMTTLTNCSISGNQASINGGGVYTGVTSETTLIGCTISGNNATGDGGGVCVTDQSNNTLTNCTVSGNTASGSGGGIYSNDSGLSLANLTVAANTAAQGGGLDIAAGTATIVNTLVAANSAATSPDAFGTFASQGNNLVGESDGSSGWVNSDQVGTISRPINALLAPLENYGGPTQTMALLPGSPAIDAGNNALVPTGVTTDQRGLSRIVNGTVDIGAFESSGFTETVVSGSPQSAQIGAAFDQAIEVMFTANNSLEPVAGGIVTFTVPGSGASAKLANVTVIIGADGTASTTAIANSIAGSYDVDADATGVSAPAMFMLTNTLPPPVSIDAELKITFGGFVLNRKTGQFTQTVKITNVSGAVITGPINLVLLNLKKATLVNQSGTYEGSAYLTLLSSGSLGIGGSLSATLTFADPTQAAITYMPEFLMGPLPQN
jgi:parallel beta-helix repeat protein